MCFGIGWSATSFGIGVFCSIVSYMNNLPLALTCGCIYISIKELLQLGLYFNLESCTNLNRLLSTLSWIHISFQPFFFNWLVSAFSKNKDMYLVPMALCVVFAIANILRLAEFRTKIKYKCTPDDNLSENFCRKKTCSYSGKYHLAYGFELASSDLNTLWTPGLFTYHLLTYIPALVIGDWWLVAIHATFSLGASLIAPHDMGESAAIWCLNASWIGFLALYFAFIKK